MKIHKMSVLVSLCLLACSINARADTPPPATPVTIPPPTTSVVAPELQHSIAGVIDASKDGLVAAGSMAKDAVTTAAKFVQDQAPDVARQLVGYKLIENLIPAVGNLIWTLIAGCVLIGLRNLKWFDDYGPTRYGMIAALFFVSGVITFGAIFSFAPEILQCWLTPKAVLFQMIRHAL